MSMTRVSRINLLAALVAIAGAVLAATLGHRESAVRARVHGAASSQLDQLVTLDDGTKAVRDGVGGVVPVREYRRIASGSTVADWLLMELCPATRVIAVTQRSLDRAPWRHRFAGKDGLADLSNVEALLSLKSDLLLMDSFGDPRRVARLREGGLVVFDMGQMRGLASLWPTIVRVGALCGQPERAQVLLRRLKRDMITLAAHVPDDARPGGLYLSPYGEQLFGGTRGTGYHDLLLRAGVRDVAAADFSDFPSYSAEQVLRLDPELIVTRENMARAVCNHAGLAQLRACQRADAIVELPGFALDDPGMGLIESIETLYYAVHGTDAR